MLEAGMVLGNTYQIMGEIGSGVAASYIRHATSGCRQMWW